ncbi:MAG TPA: hypothetical protein VK054_06890, partial [Beutenbergiaceae bacterium]|nr:hypothetical protein [Beutenbergiaceae bacterium]
FGVLPAHVTDTVRVLGLTPFNAARLAAAIAVINHPVMQDRRGELHYGLFNEVAVVALQADFHDAPVRSDFVAHNARNHVGDVG